MTTLEILGLVGGTATLVLTLIGVVIKLIELAKDGRR
jgi:hypothetical protein